MFGYLLGLLSFANNEQSSATSIPHDKEDHKESLEMQQSNIPHERVGVEVGPSRRLYADTTENSREEDDSSTKGKELAPPLPLALRKSKSSLSFLSPFSSSASSSPRRLEVVKPADYPDVINRSLSLVPRPLNLCNFRDIGRTFRQKDGDVVIKKGCIFRSGSPIQINAEEALYLSEFLHVNVLIDLRSNQERKWNSINALLTKKYKPSDNTDRRYYSIPYVGDGFVRGIFRKSTAGAVARSITWFLLWNQKKGVEALLDSFGLHDLYEVFLETCKKEFLKVLSILSDPRNYPSWVFCSIGKDRTGLTIALVLACLGVSKENICREYALSTQKPPEMVTSSNTVVPGANLMAAPPEVMWATLTFLEQKYGSVRQYLISIGFTESLQERLRDNLLEKKQEQEAPQPLFLEAQVPSSSAAGKEEEVIETTEKEAKKIEAKSQHEEGGKLPVEKHEQAAEAQKGGIKAAVIKEMLEDPPAQ
jgi:protein tyrosine/serine phosphatase